MDRYSQNAFLDRVKRKSGSVKSVNSSKVALIHFTRFCDSVYDKTPEVVVSELKISIKDDSELLYQFIDEDNEIEKSKSCKICDGRLLPAKINKKFSNWASFMPPPEDIDDGCEVVSGLFSIIDFFEEKMVFYENNHDEIYHKTRRELDEERRERNPLIYCRNTNSQKLDFF